MCERTDSSASVSLAQPKSALPSAFCSHRGNPEDLDILPLPLWCFGMPENKKSTRGMAGIRVTMVTNLIRAGSSGVDFKRQHGILCV